jgi:hypothetical protein
MRLPLRRVYQHLLDHGPAATAVSILGKLVATAGDPLLRPSLHPTLRGLFEAADATFTQAALAADRIIGPGAATPVIDEYNEARQLLREAYSRAALTYPTDWSVGEDTAFLLFTLVRRLRPARILETGVANGHSTFLLVDALRRNGTGTLTSIDVDPGAGSLLAEVDKSRWDFRILRGPGYRGAFEDIVTDLPGIDLFLHDSDHRYRWQRLELDTVYARTGGNALFACDDADSSYAFLDFCAAHRSRPVLLVEPRKVLGVVRPAS